MHFRVGRPPTECKVDRGSSLCVLGSRGARGLVGCRAVGPWGLVGYRRDRVWGACNMFSL